MGLYQIVIGAAALLVFYVAYALIRVALISRAKKKRLARGEPTTTRKSAAETLPQRTETLPPPKTGPEPRAETMLDGPVRGPTATTREPFDGLIEGARLRFQIEALEASQAAMREALENSRAGIREAIDAAQAPLREELNTLRGEIETLRKARSVAPLYNEAVALAQRGLDSSAIAERCGISVSEAELVVALARSVSRGE